MRNFTGTIRTNKIGSECEFEFKVEDDTTPENIEELAREQAFQLIEWNFEEVVE